MALVYPRAKKAGWLWTDVMKGYQYTPSEVKSYHKLGGALVFFSGVIGLWITILVGETSLNLSPMVVNEVSVV
ncbi:MAG: hypothetical protein NYU39_03805, partial [Aigarchaeota archaeon]|nr:hypothetical protein [Candidatus Caldarchaeales archaeon]